MAFGVPNCPFLRKIFLPARAANGVASEDLTASPYSLSVNLMRFGTSFLDFATDGRSGGPIAA
eukprot:scaffold6675_cov115-Pinguiococcus_pyrenoidosus.AAC.1